tara:strand:- start:23717 stop:24037 length:321 start_codon:yes stop_codon:yes gene_type:complete
MIAILLVTLIGLMEIIGDIVLKNWSLGKVEMNKYMIIGIITYIIIAILYAFSLKHGMLSVVNAMWQGISLLFTFLLAVLYFKERPSTKQLLCIGLIFIGTLGLMFI